MYPCYGVPPLLYVLDVSIYVDTLEAEGLVYEPPPPAIKPPLPPV